MMAHRGLPVLARRVTTKADLDQLLHTTAGHASARGPLEHVPQPAPIGRPVGPPRRCQRQQRGGLAVWVWGGTVVSTWVT